MSECLFHGTKMDPSCHGCTSALTRYETLREVLEKRGEILNQFPLYVPVDAKKAWDLENEWLREQAGE